MIGVVVGAFVARSLAVGSRSLAMPCPILRLLPSRTIDLPRFLACHFCLAPKSTSDSLRQIVG